MTCVVLTFQTVFGCAWMGKLTGNASLEAQNLIEQAERADEAGNVEEAGVLLGRAIEANPEDSEARRKLARLLLEGGDVDAAVRQLRAAVVQNPDDVDSFVGLARIQMDHGRTDGAEWAIVQALEIEAGHVGALLLLAELAEARGSEPLALETYHRILAGDPENIRARQRIAEIQIASGRPERAAPLLRAVCESETATEEQAAEARWTLGIAYGRQRRWRDSSAALAQAATHRKTMSADDWYRLAYARFAAGDRSGAYADASTALRLQPGHSQAAALTGALERSYAGLHPPSTTVRRMAMAVPAPAGW